MNDARRKEIAKAVALIEEAKGILEEAQLGEQDYFDNMPDIMQSGYKGSIAETNASSLQDAVDSCDAAVSSCEEAASS